MDTHCPPALLRPAAPPARPRLFRRLAAALDRFLSHTRFVSVDLTDTVYLSLRAEQRRVAAERLNCSE